MAIIDVVKYDGSDNILAWKYPSSELAHWTQVIVNESQEAIFYRGGQALDLFTAGRHTLSTENIPLLSNLINLPFGGNSPFAAEIWFVNKKHVLDVKWGTRHPVQLQDPKYNIFVPVRAFGQFGIRINDSRKFLVKLVGTLKEFNQETLTEYFRGFLMTKIKDHISSYLIHKKISLLEINAYLSDISEHITSKVIPQFEIYGIEILNFYVNSINVPEEDEAVKRLKNALAKRAEMDIVGFDYRQQRSFDTLESAAKNEGGAQVGMMGAGMGLGMGFGMGGAFGTGMSDVSRHIQTSSSVPEKAATCSKCYSAIQKGYKFCPNCGDEYYPCPNCGEDNDKDSTVCRRCKISLPTICPNCSEAVSGNVKFCPSCGNSMVKRCEKCQHEIQPGQKFCPQCSSPQ